MWIKNIKVLGQTNISVCPNYTVKYLKANKFQPWKTKTETKSSAFLNFKGRSAETTELGEARPDLRLSRVSSSQCYSGLIIQLRDRELNLLYIHQALGSFSGKPKKEKKEKLKNKRFQWPLSPSYLLPKHTLKLNRGRRVIWWLTTIFNYSSRGYDILASIGFRLNTDVPSQP